MDGLTSEVVDDLWNKVYGRETELIKDWIKCLSNNWSEGVRDAKYEISLTVANREYRCDPKKNIFVKMIDFR